MKSGWKKNVFAGKFKFTSCWIGSILTSIWVSLQQKPNTFGTALRITKLQLRVFVDLCRRFDSADFVYSFIYLLCRTSMWLETREWVQAGIWKKQFWERRKPHPPRWRLLQPLPLRVPVHWAGRRGAANSLISADPFASWDAPFLLKRVCLLLSMCLCPIPASGPKKSEQVPTTPQYLPITSLYTQHHLTRHTNEIAQPGQFLQGSHMSLLSRRWLLETGPVTRCGSWIAQL